MRKNIKSLLQNVDLLFDLKSKSFLIEDDVYEQRRQRNLQQQQQQQANDIGAGDNAQRNQRNKKKKNLKAVAARTKAGLKLEKLLKISTLEGSASINRIREVILMFIMKPTEAQLLFITSFIDSLTPFLYGDEWTLNRNEIKQYNNLTEQMLKPYIACSMPRRFGKTVSVAMLVASLLYAVDGIRVLIFSKSLRQVKLMGEQVRKLFFELPGSKQMVVKNNQELFMTCRRGRSFASSSPCSEINYLPGTSNSTRGVGGDLIVLEEAGFVDETLFHSTIVPLLRKKNSVLLAISTPGIASNNTFNMMFDIHLPKGHRGVVDVDNSVGQTIKNEGEMLFKLVRVVTICDACTRKKKTSCIHLGDIIKMPSWLSSGREEDVKLIYETLNAGDIQRREIGGQIIDSDRIEAWDPVLIDKVFGPRGIWDRTSDEYKEVCDPFYRFKLQTMNYGFQNNQRVSPPSYVYIGVDPSGGGSQSDTAIATLFHTGSGNDRLVVLGLDTIPMMDSQREYEANVIAYHIRFIREQLGWHDTKIVIVIEANGEWNRVGVYQTYILADLRLQETRETLSFYSGDKTDLQRPGIITTNVLKAKFASMVNHILLNRNLKLADPLVSYEYPVRLDADNDMIDNKQKQLRSVFYKQLRAYTLLTEEKRDGSTVQFYSGKAGRQKDDLCMAFQIVTYVAEMYRRERLISMNLAYKIPDNRYSDISGKRKARHVLDKITRKQREFASSFNRLDNEEEGSDEEDIDDSEVEYAFDGVQCDDDDGDGDERSDLISFAINRP